jgi:serine/threonine-protein kinase
VQPASASDDAASAKCADAFDASQQLSQVGKLQDALQELLVCAQPTCPAFLSRECTEDYERIKRSMPTVTFVANDANGSPLADVVVSVDGKRVADRIAGLATPIDPGLHEFVFEHAGDPPVTLSIMIAEGEKNRRVVAEFGAKQPPSSPPPATVPAAPAAKPPAPAAHSGVPTATYVFAGMGLAALGTGVAFRLIGAADYNSLAEDCGTRCTDEQVDEVKSKYTISNISFGVGAAALVAGGVFYFVNRGGSSKKASAHRLQARPVYLDGGGAAGLIEGKF